LSLFLLLLAANHNLNVRKTPLFASRPGSAIVTACRARKALLKGSTIDFLGVGGI